MVKKTRQDSITTKETAFPEKIKAVFRKGNGEIISFAVVSTIICILVIIMAAFLQLSAAMNSLAKAASVASRSAAVCTSLEDAQDLAQLAAESSITDTSMDDIQVEVAFAGGTGSWETGGYLKVTVSADVSTLEPYVLSGRRSKSTVVCIEGSSTGDWNYTEDELRMICSIVAAEDDTCYEGALAVITCACNRAESASYSSYGSDPLSQLTVRSQFSGYQSVRYFLFYNGSVAIPDYVTEAVTAALNGERNHYYYNFRSSYRPGSEQIGGNYYF